MVALKYPRFETLDFGRLSAEEERRVAPNLLQAGYYDHKEAAYKLATGAAYFVIGRKGSGKSAALGHLALKWENRADRFLTSWDLGSFPLADVTTLQIGTKLGPSSTRAAWEFLLLLKVFESLMRDNGRTHPSDVTTLRKSLVAEGLIEGPDLKTRFTEWSSTTVKFPLGTGGFGGERKDSAATALQVAEIVKRAVRAVSTPNRHLITIDGLDSFFAQAEDQMQSLGGLLAAVTSVNHFMQDTGLLFSIVTAIRSDLLLQAPTTDSAKTADNSLEMDWSLGEYGESSQLWELVNRKAKASVQPSFSGQQLGDIRKAYLSGAFNYRNFPSIPDFFIEHTRLLPRDLIALLNALREEQKGSGLVSEQSARSAVRRYGDTYFVREIVNNLSFILPGQSATKVTSFIEALSSLDSRRFLSDNLRQSLEGEVDASEVRILLRQMFTVGAIGIRTGGGKKKHTNFSYRRVAGGGFKYPSEMVLHNALGEAWNIQP
jgi:hypothetical protein